MEKICKICGKPRFMLSWEDTCYTCKQKQHLTAIQQMIKDNQEDVDTFSSDYIICPYCGNALDTKYGYEDFPELYEEGDHELECDECGKTFILETMVSYSYETRKPDE
nr:MAG TPA: zinc-ribbon domain protein [Caudoviricetes sp.]